MANTETSASSTKAGTAAAASTMSILAPALGWLIPGAGHLVQRRWIRGLLIFVSVTAMFGFGVAMDGKVYKPNAGDLIEMLAFVGDLGAGGLYFLARIFSWGSDAITYAAADYGTKYIAVAGLLNIMSIVDAHHIAIGKKQ